MHWITAPTHPPSASAPVLPFVRHATSLAPARWVQRALTTFATSVASFLPGDFAAYARLYHPFLDVGVPSERPTRWQDLSRRHGITIDNMRAAEAFADHGEPNRQAPIGTMPLAVLDALLDHLGPATSTPDACAFAVWTGYGGLVLPPDLTPRLELPHREYHLFEGPVDGARTSYAYASLVHQSANLWWPADHEWFVATEVDHAWSYVGGSAALVAAILADERLEAVGTTAQAHW
jgi:hypothetical protein